MEKTVAVKLTARTTQYIAAMAAATKATTGLSTSATSLQRVGASMMSVGASMTRYVTVPLVALGAGAVVMASRFETAFAQMVGLANVPASEVDHLKESVLALAGETARAPQELADALYLAASSGLDSAAAMEVVTIAAHGAAAGMGTTQDIVSLLTSAIGAYGAENLTAAQAGDFLSASVRDGKAAADELATTMGRVLPIAASMGISMGEVGGALAFLTNVGLDTDQAVTGLREALMKLSNPGRAARQALEDMGTSSGELQAAIAQDGLMGALNLLREHGFAGNTAALHALMPEMRGYAAILPLLTDANHTLDGIMGDVTGSTGSMGTAFDAVASTSAFKMKQAFTEIQVALVQIGSILLPFAADVAGAIGGLVEWFSKLPGPVQDAAVAFGVLAAIGGPVVFMAGKMLTSFASLVTGLAGIVGGVGTASLVLGGLALAIGAGFLIYEHFTEHQREMRARTDEVTVALGSATGQALDYANTLVTASTSVAGLTIAQDALSIALVSTGEGGVRLTQALGTLGLQASDAYEILSNINRDGGDGLYRVAVQAGFAADESAILSMAALKIGADWPLAGARATGAMQDIADQFGTTLPHVQEVVFANYAAVDSLRELNTQANGVNLNALSQGYLRTAATVSVAGEKFVELAEMVSGASRNGENATAAYAALLDIVSGLPATQEAAARTALGMGEAVGGVGDEVNRNNALITDYTNIILDAGAATVDTSSATQVMLHDLFGIGSAATTAAMGIKTWGTEMVGAKDAVGGLGGEIDTAAEAFDVLQGMATRNPAALAIVHLAELHTNASRAGKDSVRVLQEVIRLLRTSSPEWATWANQMLGGFLDAGKGLGVVNEQFSKAQTAAKEWTGATVAAKSAVGQLGDTTHDALTPIADLMAEMTGAARAMSDAATRADEFRDSVSRLRAPQEDLRSATRDVWTELDNMSQALDDNGTSFSVNTKKGRDNQVQLETTRDAIMEHGAALLENGASAATAAADIAFNVLQLNNQWRAAGMTEGQIAMLNAQYGLTPEQVTTYLQLLGDKTAREKLGAYIAEVSKVPAVVYTTATPTVNWNAYYKTQSAVAAFGKTIYTPVTPYLTTSTLYVSVKASGASISHSAAGRYVDSPMLSTLGESGAEVVLPLTNPGRMSALLGMSEVGPRVAAAMGAQSSYSAMSTAVYNQYNTINMPPGSNGDDVVRALKRYQRRSGPVPITTR